jgi:hypothetical protein
LFIFHRNNYSDVPHGFCAGRSNLVIPEPLVSLQASDELVEQSIGSTLQIPNGISGNVPAGLFVRLRDSWSRMQP